MRSDFGHAVDRQRQNALQFGALHDVRGPGVLAAGNEVQQVAAVAGRQARTPAAPVRRIALRSATSDTRRW